MAESFPAVYFYITFQLKICLAISIVRLISIEKENVVSKLQLNWSTG